MSRRFSKEEIAEAGGGLIAWMARHAVAANLLMLIFLAGGLFMLAKTTKEVFPEFAPDTVSIGMSYPGASPEEVEKSIVLAIEDALRDIDGIGEIASAAREGSGSVQVEILDSEETMRIMQDITSATDRITTFPAEAENLRVSLNSRRRSVMEIALYGDLGEHALREAAERLRERLQANPAIGPVELQGVRNMEIHIEVPQENLRRYRLTLPEISARIRAAALELGGGSLKTGTEEILVRMKERREYAADFRDIPLIALENGGKITLGDIARISEGFEDSNNSAGFNGKPAILMAVYRIGNQTPTGVAKAVYGEIAGMGSFLPEELQIGIVDDDSDLFRQRAALMIKNGLWGLGLVLFLLAVFLDIRLAFWVAMGLPVSMLGAFLLFPATDFTINVITMFAFIITLGIVVDDAIVAGENIYTHRQEGSPPLKAAVEGTREVAVPIFMSILTNIIAFLPLLFIPGIMGKVFGVIPVVIIAVFTISLIECLFILPAHLTFRKAVKDPQGPVGRFVNIQKSFNRRFETFVEHFYGAFMKKAIRARYLTLAVFVSLLAGMGGYAFSGRMGMQLFPSVESDYAFASAALKVGAPETHVREAAEILAETARLIVEENGGAALSEGIYTTIGDNVAEVRVFLTEPEVRPIQTRQFTQIWRDRVGDMAGVETLSFQSNRGGPGSGAALTIELSHRDTNILDEAGAQLAGALAAFPAAKDIDDGSAQGKRQYDFRMTDLGHTLGMNAADVARQVRAAFYGSEAFKQQRGRDEIRVLARLPETERASEYDLKNLVLRTPAGSEVLLRDVVMMTEGRAYTVINRRNGRRNIQVKADIDPPEQVTPVVNALKNRVLPELQQRYPGLSYSFEGRQAEIRDSVSSLFYGLLAVLFVMYALLAMLFGSYSQPFMVLTAIPFSAIGAVAGHLLMGYSLSVMSLFGMMALAGVVVNGSLVLIDFANRRRDAGIGMTEGLVEASIRRFRPILLTTLTTFAGLAPMIFETSRQAKFLIPMALSLGYGILFSIFVTLILIPVLYVIIEDLKKLFQKIARRLFSRPFS